MPLFRVNGVKDGDLSLISGFKSTQVMDKYTVCITEEFHRLGTN